MTEFEKQVYADMSSVNRVELWMMKATELIEFMDCMTEHDFKLIRETFGNWEKEGKLKHDKR